MQRGIHASLDNMKEADMAYLDTVITRKLCALGLDGEHELFYLRKSSDGRLNETDTFAITGTMKSEPSDVFNLELSPDSEYRMVIPRWHMAVLKELMPVILFSLFTFLLLIGTFWYLIDTMRKQRQLDEIKEDFTNNITHELKTPIAVAYAANDSLLNFDSASNTPRMNRYLAVCQEQLRLLDRLVEQILSLSMELKKSLLLNMEYVSVRELVESLVATFNIKYPAKAGFTLEIEEGLTLMTDRMHLSNIVGNLIDNAIKYSHGDADVTVRAYGGKKEDVVIEVEDNGIGITHVQQKFIFDKFYRVPHGNLHDVKGYGLGLFYVKSMTEMLHKRVNVMNENAPENHPGNMFIGSYSFDPVSQYLCIGDHTEILSSRESGIFAVLAADINEIVPAAHIMKSLWGDDTRYIANSLQVFINRLRQRLKHDPSVKIINARGVGYKLAVDFPKHS